MTPEYVIPRDVSSGFALEFKSSYDQIVSHLGSAGFDPCALLTTEHSVYVVFYSRPVRTAPSFGFVSLSGWIILAVSWICMVWFTHDTILELF